MSNRIPPKQERRNFCLPPHINIEKNMQVVNTAAVIPNWNGGENLRHCLLSIAGQSHLPSEVVVVDNGSHDSSWEAVQRVLPWAKLIRLDSNFGFSYAVNCGIKASTTEWVVLINNDVVLRPDFFGRLMGTLEENPGFDFAAAKLLQADDSTIVDGAGDGILMAGASFRLGHGLPDDGSKEVREVFSACGAAAAYRRSLFEEVGYFDEDFFAYLEDVDIALRARWAGRRCMYIPTAVALHKGSQTFGGKLQPPIIRLITQNQILLLTKNYTAGILRRAWFRIIIFQLLWLGFAIRTGVVSSWLKGVLGALKRLPSVFKKKRQRIRRTTADQMWQQLQWSEQHVYRSYRVQEGGGSTMLRVYFRLFHPLSR